MADKRIRHGPGGRRREQLRQNEGEQSHIEQAYPTKDQHIPPVLLRASRCLNGHIFGGLGHGAVYLREQCSIQDKVAFHKNMIQCFYWSIMENLSSSVFSIRRVPGLFSLLFRTSKQLARCFLCSYGKKMLHARAGDPANRRAKI